MRKIGMAYLLPFRCILFFIIFMAGAAITKKELYEISSWWSIVATSVNIVTVLLIILIARKNGSTYLKTINYQKEKTSSVQIITITLLILAIGTAGMYLAGLICFGVIPYAPPAMIEPIPIVPAILNLILLPLTTVFAEEGLYLGCGVNQLKNKFAAVFIPAFFFSLQHSFIPTVLDARFIIYRFLSFLPLCIFLCWYYYKKRNPLPIMIGHAILDLATAMMILATSSVPELIDRISAV